MFLLLPSKNPLVNDVVESGDSCASEHCSLLSSVIVGEGEEEEEEEEELEEQEEEDVMEMNAMSLAKL